MKSFLLMGYLLTTAIAGAQNLNDGLIVYYPLDGNCLDSSINHFHGITNAAYVEDHNGNPGKALHFNGFDQYMDFPPNRPELKPELPVSVAYWVRFDTISPYFGTVFATDFDQNNHSGVWMCLSSSGGTIGVSYGSGFGNTGPDNRKTKKGSTGLQAHQWYFVIAIVRGETDMDIYLDCVNDGGTYDGTGGDLAYTDCQGNMGRKDANVYAPPYYFKGTIDEFRYWNRELTLQDMYVLCEELPVAVESYERTEEDVILANPVGDQLSFTALPEQATLIEIVDLSGKVIMISSPSISMNVSSLSPGIYFIRFLDEGGKVISAEKFIKK